ncbi:protein jagged-1-like isoform X2 [Anneissia japonica]|uniref:protein jagged-1-like isoform X2 n=1 Tax=Anneissia japonica TaxID=1529436 RepID=UPI0014256664|nr:protein jagged-1-like isoform X2 [Anneissia japonica]
MTTTVLNQFLSNSFLWIIMIYKNYFIVCMFSILCMNVARCSLIVEIEMVSFTSDGRLDVSGIRCDNGRCDNYFKLCVLTSDIPENCIKTDIVLRNNDSFTFPSELPNHNSSLPSIPNPFEIYIPEWPTKDADKVITLEVYDWDKKDDDLLYKNITDISDIQLIGTEPTEPQVRILENSNGKSSTKISVRLYCETGFTGPGCSQRDTVCHPNTCLNKGKCIETGERVKCHCAGGFTGDWCETRLDPCKIGNCKHGNCTPGLNSYTCECFQGFTGDDCDQDIDECQRHPCQYEGTCVNLQPGFKCQCPPGRSGKFCALDVDECASNPCLNNGTCNHGIDHFECECVVGFQGDLCEINTNECDNVPCMNKGTCVDKINGYECVCSPGFKGLNCEVNIDNCAGPTPCLNGGTCVDGVDIFACVCQDQYLGRQCEIDSSKSGVQVDVKDPDKLDLAELQAKFSDLIKEHVPGTEDVEVQSFVPSNQNPQNDLTQIIFVIFINNTLVAESDANKMINAIPEGERAKLIAGNTNVDEGAKKTNDDDDDLTSSSRKLLEGMVLGLIVFQAIIVILILIRRRKRYTSVHRQEETTEEITEETSVV